MGTAARRHVTSLIHSRFVDCFMFACSRFMNEVSGLSFFQFFFPSVPAESPSLFFVYILHNTHHTHARSCRCRSPSLSVSVSHGKYLAGEYRPTGTEGTSV